MSNWKRIVIAMVLFATSGCETQTYFNTRLGSIVYLNHHPDWIDEPTASLLEEELLADLQWGEKAERCAGWAYFWIWDYPVDPYTKRAGFQDGRDLTIGAHPAGPRYSAFKHELCHYLQECVLGIVDINHTRPEWVYCNSREHGASAALL